MLALPPRFLPLGVIELEESNLFHFSAFKYVVCPQETTLSSSFMFSEQIWKIPNNVPSLEVNRSFF